MSRYLSEAPRDEAMRVLHNNSSQPLKHTIYTHDFMALGAHNIACQVCFDETAVLERNVTPGQWRQEVQPCRSCQAKGWRTVKLPRLLRRWFARS